MQLPVRVDALTRLPVVPALYEVEARVFVVIVPIAVLANDEVVPENREVKSR